MSRHPETEAIKAITRLVAEVTGVEVADVLGPSRSRSVTAARGLAAALCVDLVRGATTTTIAHALGGRHHSFAVRAAQAASGTAKYAALKAMAIKLEEVRAL